MLVTIVSLINIIIMLIALTKSSHSKLNLRTYYFAHRIQQPIPKLQILHFYKKFNQSDCFNRKKQITIKQTRLVKLVPIGQIFLLPL